MLGSLAHIQFFLSILVDLEGWPPTLHSLPLEQVINTISVFGSIGELIQTTTGGIVDGLRHPTQVHVNSSYGNTPHQ